MAVQDRCTKCGGRLSKDDQDIVCEMCGYRDSNPYSYYSLRKTNPLADLNPSVRRVKKYRLKG